MGERWIVDASPIIALAKIGQAPLLEQITDELLVPEAVASEALSAPPEDPARILLESKFGRRAAPGELPARVLEWSLGRGETEVLALGLEQRGSRVVIDDVAARRCAIALEVPMIGTLGVLVRAKHLGLVESAASIFHGLRAVGFRIAEATAREVLSRIGEKWKRLSESTRWSACRLCGARSSSTRPCSSRRRKRIRCSTRSSPTPVERAPEQGERTIPGGR